MNTLPHVPPGFRFYPTDEELVDYYLRKKVASGKIDLNVIREVDLYKIEPWDLPEFCRIGAEEQHEWHFFSHKDKKYPTGTRTNRATKTGFWKATGRDKPIYFKHNLIGMRKTLVYYMGRAPNGQKSDWIMHEYRLESNENGAPQEEGWVVCKVFKKRVTAIKRASEVEPSHWFEEQVSFIPDNLDAFHHLPHLQSPKLLVNFANYSSSHQFPHAQNQLQTVGGNMIDQYQSEVGHVTDWRILDKFVASQLSPGDVSKEPNLTDLAKIIQVSNKREEAAEEFESISNSSCPIELWM